VKVVPSVDISGGKAVKRIKGKRDTGLQLGDPVAVASELRKMGYDSIHVVDLDAAEGIGNNWRHVLDIIKVGFLRVTVGGGIRDRERLNSILKESSTIAVMSTLPFTEPEKFREAVRGVEDRVMISVDYCGDHIFVKGWNEGVKASVAIDKLNGFKVRGFIFTYVCNEGTKGGIDERIGGWLKLICGEKGYAGGIASTEDLRRLKEMGFDFAIVGMALYIGAIRGVLNV
jgi:phosphoribosylformimino-5-aminoimidazole carboxamide ribotide isomerase